MLQEFKQRPRCGCGAGAVTREHGGDQHAGDLVISERGAVRVASLHESLQEIFSALSAVASLTDDLRNHLAKPGAGLVTPSESGNRKVRVDIRDRDDALLQVAIDTGE